jgi:hypothetical protein
MDGNSFLNGDLSFLGILVPDHGSGFSPNLLKIGAAGDMLQRRSKNRLLVVSDFSLVLCVLVPPDS